MKRHARHTPHGQSLLELIVASGIIIICVVAVLGLVLMTTTSSSSSKTQILATNLAREGIEVARSIRDANWLIIDSEDPSRLWHQDLFGQNPDFTNDYTAIAQFQPPVPVGIANPWTLDFNPDDIDDNRAIIYLNPANGRYSQIGNPSGATNCGPPPEPFCNFQATQFRRLITLNPICWPDPGVPSMIDDLEMITTTEGTTYCNPTYRIVGVQVKSRVRWIEHGRVSSVELVEKLFNWKP
jgi:type II secretory pathway pseudopilin PulG